MDKTLRNIHDSLKPLDWLLRIFALNRNVEDQPKAQAIFLLKMLLTMGLIGSLVSFCMYYKVVYIFQNISTSIKLTDSVQMIFDHIQYVVDLWFIYKFRGHVTLGYLKKYVSIDIILGITDCNIIKKKLANLVFIFTSIWVVSTAFDFMAWYQVYGLITPLIYSIAYLYLFIKMVTMLELTSHILHIEIRLTIIADLVQHYYTVCPNNWIGMTEDSTCKNTSSPSILNLKKRIQPLQVLSKNKYNEVQLVTKCYLLLTEQVEFIKCMFGFRILLNSLSLLIDIIRFTNISVRLILGTQVVIHGSKFIPAVSCLVRMLTCVAVLLSLVLHCENTYDQSDKIVSIIDHILVNKDPNEKLRTAMVELRALVLSRPISFIMAKFFRLDFQFLMSIGSVIVTYTIILLQNFAELLEFADRYHKIYEYFCTAYPGNSTASCLVRMLTCVAMLISLVFHCENAYDQKDKIVSIIDQILVNKDPNEKLRAALIELRALVLTRPISFSMAKFFRLDFQFLMSIASITVTYTIILLQSMN